MNANHRRELIDALMIPTFARREAAVVEIIATIEDWAFNAGRDSAPQFPGAEDVMNRLDALEDAVTTLYPLWRVGGHEPSCTCVACCWTA